MRVIETVTDLQGQSVEVGQGFLLYKLWGLCWGPSASGADGLHINEYIKQAVKSEKHLPVLKKHDPKKPHLASKATFTNRMVKLCKEAVAMQLLSVFCILRSQDTGTVGQANQGALKPVFLTPFEKYLLCTGYAVFCCAVLENFIATSSVNICKMTAIRQSTTCNMCKFPNPYLVFFFARLCSLLVPQVEKRVGWAHCVKPWQRDRNCLGMRESAVVGIAQAQGAALHNQKARRCTSYVIPTKQMVLLRLSVAWSPPAAVRGEMPAALHGQCHAMRALKTSKSSMFAAGDSSTFFATHRRRDNRSFARVDCAD